MSGLKNDEKNIRQMFLNPVVLAAFLELILWIIQPYMPTLTGLNPETNKAVTVAFYRIDVTAQWLFKPLTYLASLSSHSHGFLSVPLWKKSALNRLSRTKLHGTTWLLKPLLYQQLI